MSEQAAAAIAILCDAYPRQDFPERSSALYGRMLGDLPGPELVQAVKRLIYRSTFLPSISEIRREVAEARLELPDGATAWEILRVGSLRDAPREVRAAAEGVGGRASVMHTDRPEILRAQFLKLYAENRTRSVELEMGARTNIVSLSARRLAELPPASPDRIRPRPVMAREIMRLIGKQPGVPTDAERADAIDILAAGPEEENPRRDFLYAAAERCFHEAGEEPS